MDYAISCRFSEVLPRNFPHILEMIFLHLDYESFKTCYEVCKMWSEFILSDSIQRKAKLVFSREVVKDASKLLKASRDGNIKVITRLLSTRMLDINSALDGGEDRDDYHFDDDYEATTPLFEAARNGHTNAVRLLLERGAKPNVWHEFGDTPLLIAAEEGHKEVIKLLLAGGADPNMADNEKNYPLHCAIIQGHGGIVQLLLEKGADPKMTDDFGDTPLMRAAKEGHKEMVKILLDGGVDPNMTDEEKDHPLHYAAIEGHKGIAQLLLEAGVNPNIANKAGETALELAFDNYLQEVEELLLEKGAQPFKDYYELRLLRAIMEGNTKEVTNNFRISTYVVDVNYDHSEPLKEAIRLGHKEMVHLLLSSGANPNPPMREIDWYDEMIDDPRETPLKLALKRGRRDLARILLDAGAEPDKVDEETINEWEYDWGADIPPPSEYDVGRGKRQSLITKYFVRK